MTAATLTIPIPTTPDDLKAALLELARANHPERHDLTMGRSTRAAARNMATALFVAFHPEVKELTLAGLAAADPYGDPEDRWVAADDLSKIAARLVTELETVSF